MLVGRAFLASLLIALVGCGEDILLPEEVAGTYVLQTINGDPLPWNIGSTADKILDIMAGSAVLGLDSSCNVSVTIQTAQFDIFGELQNPTTRTESDICSYVLDGGGLTLNYLVGDPDTGSVSGSEVTLLREENVYVFKK